MEASEVVLQRVKRVWCQPEKPAQIRVRPASRVGIVLARWKCHIGLAVFAWGLRHLSILNPARQVGESALSIMAEKMATTPNGTFIGPTEQGPRIYLGEVVLLLCLAAVATVFTVWCLYAVGLLPYGVDDFIRLHLTDPLLHRHETRTLRQTG